MRWVKVLGFALFFLSLPQFMKRDFKVPVQLKEIGFNPTWEMGPPDESIQFILSQPFIYLTHGNQSTVFASQDGQYVLKLFRYTRARFPLVQNLKCWIAMLHRKKPKQNLISKANKTLTATSIACTQARAFTQAVFCHLNLTENTLPITQFKADRTYYLPLDHHRFVLQKKVAPFKETLLAARGNPEEMHRLINSWVNLLIQRAALGIRNSDPNLGPNFGFLDGQAVEIDFGNYMLVPQTRIEIAGYFIRLEHWLNKNAPEYVDDLKELRRNSLISYDQSDETAATFHRSPRTLD